MPENVAKFNPNGGPLEVQIIIGENKVGICNFFLFDKNDGPQLQYGAGNYQSAKFSISTPPADLDGMLVVWSATVNAPNNQPNQNWSVSMIIRQDHNAIAEIDDSGTFQTVEVMSDKVRLEAQ